MHKTKQTDLAHQAMDETADYAHELYAHVAPAERHEMTIVEIIGWLLCSLGPFVLLMLLASR